MTLFCAPISRRRIVKLLPAMEQNPPPKICSVGRSPDENPDAFM
jgi:hypothetical protein